MNKSTVLLIIGFVVVMAGAFLLYGMIPEDAQPIREKPEFETSAESSMAESGNPPAVNEPILAPEFKALDMDGNDVQYSDLTGVPVVLNFWASWCGPCKIEMPDFQKVYEEYDESRLQFRMINLTDGSRETVDTAKAFLEENGYTFPVWFDSYQEAAYYYGVRSIPSTVFINAQGHVVGAWEGYLTEDGLREAIAGILPEDSAQEGE